MQEVSGSIPLTSTIGAEMVEVAGGNCLFLRPGGYSSAGRALAWHARGQRFDPAYLHQQRRDKVASCRSNNVVPRSPSSRGLGHHPFTVSTGVRIPLGTPVQSGVLVVKK